MGLFTKMFGTYSERQIKKLKKTLNMIDDPKRVERYKNMSDEELASQTVILKERLLNGETLDMILPDAFCVVREADDRVLGKRPFKVQMIGGIILHQGRVAEMKTGEGKTLTATLPAYLNALSGNSVHIVTVNEYLARMGAEEMGRVYDFLGLKTGLILSGQTNEEKTVAYSCDIIYGTNNEFGFDYLRDNLVSDKSARVQRDMSFAIIDEVDSILIDEARTPLIISGFKNVTNDMYEKADNIARKMKVLVVKELDAKTSLEEVAKDSGADYVVDEKARNAVLTAKGIEMVEKEFSLENFADEQNAEIAHHINLAIRARGVMKRDVDYMVDEEEGAVLIIDSFTGRIMPGRRYADGLHQAIEAKERVSIQKEDRTVATITFQNFFRLYKKLSGMTGTALTEEEEFKEIYALDVVEIPTNLPMIRIDHPDNVYKSISGKYTAIVRQIKACQEKGQPVLIGTASVEKSEELHRILLKEGIKHEVLNAKNHKREAEIVAGAGKRGAVTIATNMAGRGTDILLGGNPEFMAKQKMRALEYPEEIIAVVAGKSLSVSDEVKEARRVYSEYFEAFKKEIQPEYEFVKSVGGLFIIGTERHESRRVDNQFRGRSGRQGDPGESRFYVSFEDDLLRIYGGERMAAVYNTLMGRVGYDESVPVSGEGSAISPKILTSLIENCQKRLEGHNFRIRKNVLEYDDVINQQRRIIYDQRNEVLDDSDFHEKILAMIRETVEDAVDLYCGDDDPREWNLDALRTHFYGTLFRDEDLRYSEEELVALDFKRFKKELVERAVNKYESKAKTPEQYEILKKHERRVLLHFVDDNWIDNIDAMDDLRGTVQLQSFAQRKPIDEYRIVAQDMFDDMITNIRESTVRTLLMLEFATEPVKAPSGVTITEMANGIKAARARAKRMTVRRHSSPGASSGDKQEPVRREKTPGPNDPCSCGSGKKYKKCCGARGSES